MSIITKINKYFMAGALIVSCFGCASAAWAEAKAISMGDYYGGYVRSENYAGARYSAWLNGSEYEENSLGEFVVASESGMDGSMSYVRYIGVLTKGQSGSTHYFHVDHKVERRYDVNGKLIYLRRDTQHPELYQLLYRTPENFVLQKDGRKQTKVNFAGEYNLETKEFHMSEDAAVYMLELKASQSVDIVLQPWKHKYKYETKMLLPGDNVYDLYKKVMANEGRPHFYGGVLIDAYDEMGRQIGTYMVANDGSDIIYSEAGRHKIAWSTEAVG